MPTNKSAQTPLQCDSVVHEINEGDLSHPEAVAMLLIHLGGSDSPPYVWYKGEELIGRLRQSWSSLGIKRDRSLLETPSRLRMICARRRRRYRSS